MELKRPLVRTGPSTIGCNIPRAIVIALDLRPGIEVTVQVPDKPAGRGQRPKKS
jgi:antitoxin component of MazEF toxin-antitoxin module